MFRSKLKELRTARGVSGYRLARDAGITEMTVHNIEAKPLNHINAQSTKKLMKYFGLERIEDLYELID